MDIQRMQELVKKGYDKEWLEEVMRLWKPNSQGKYTMKITNIEDLSDDPASGEYIDTAYFSTEEELSIIHHFFEGCAYVLTKTDTGEWLGEGIIDFSPFDEVEEKDWEFLGYEETKALVENKKYENKKRLYIDIDGTLARFHDADKMFIEAMWTPGFYVGLKPFENAVEGVKQFIKEHPEVDVYILSAVLDTDPPFIVDEKNEWLDKYLPEITSDHRIFTHAGESKTDYIGKINENVYLLDDYNKNLIEFEDAGAHAIKFHNDVNMRGLGAYGGEAGPIWNGDIAHYDVSPEVFATQLANMVCGEPVKQKQVKFGYMIDSHVYEPHYLEASSFAEARSILQQKLPVKRMAQRGDDAPYVELWVDNGVERKDMSFDMVHDIVKLYPMDTGTFVCFDVFPEINSMEKSPSLEDKMAEAEKQKTEPRQRDNGNMAMDR